MGEWDAEDDIASAGLRNKLMSRLKKGLAFVDFGL